MKDVLKQRAVPLHVSNSNTGGTSHQMVTAMKHGESHLFPIHERGVEKEVFFFHLAKIMIFVRPECMPKTSKNETSCPWDDDNLNSNVTLM